MSHHHYYQWSKVNYRRMTLLKMIMKTVLEHIVHQTCLRIKDDSFLYVTLSVFKPRKKRLSMEMLFIRDETNIKAHWLSRVITTLMEIIIYEKTNDISIFYEIKKEKSSIKFIRIKRRYNNTFWHNFLIFSCFQVTYECTKTLSS